MTRPQSADVWRCGTRMEAGARCGPSEAWKIQKIDCGRCFAMEKCWLGRVWRRYGGARVAESKYLRSHGFAQSLRAGSARFVTRPVLSGAQPHPVQKFAPGTAARLWFAKGFAR